jgi:SulP family sulfate permease
VLARPRPYSEVIDELQARHPEGRLAVASRFRVLPGLTARTALRESTAGVTLLALAVPLNIGYAQIAGLPATAGLYALILPSVVYALLVSSRQLVASPDAAAAALVASSLGGLAVAGGADYATLALAQAIIGGLMFGLFALFRLGFLANFLSKPILIGFVGGLALDILVSQLAKMLGIKIDSGAEFVDKVVALISGLGTANVFSIALSVGSVIVLLVGRRFGRQVPWALAVLVVSTIVVVATGLEARGVSVLGAIEAGLPTLSWPMLPWSSWLALIPSALALTMVTMAEGLLVSRNYGEKRGYPTDPNRDLLAFGAANVAAGVSGGFTVGSSTSRTAALDQIGSRTQLPSIVAAVGTLLLLVFGTALLEHIPSPAIGAIVAVAILPLLGIGELRRLWSADRFEFVVGAVCFLGALLLGPILGILLAFVLALINLAKRAASPAIDTVGADGAATPRPAPGQPVILRFAAPLFFANAAAFERAVSDLADAEPAPRAIVLDLEAVTDVDVTGSESFAAVAKKLHDRGIRLAVSRVRPDLSRRLEHFGLLDGLVVYATNREALTGETVDPQGTTSTPGEADRT